MEPVDVEGEFDSGIIWQTGDAAEVILGAEDRRDCHETQARDYQAARDSQRVNKSVQYSNIILQVVIRFCAEGWGMMTIRAVLLALLLAVASLAQNSTATVVGESRIRATLPCRAPPLLWSSLAHLESAAGSRTGREPCYSH